MVCDRCGSSVGENDSFCPRCGNVIKKEEEPTTNNLDIFNSGFNNSTESSEQEDNLIEKYKENINFFKLSDDEKNDDNLLVNEPIFPQESFESQSLENDSKMIEPVNITPISDLSQQVTPDMGVNQIDSLAVTPDDGITSNDNINSNQNINVSSNDNLINPSDSISDNGGNIASQTDVNSSNNIQNSGNLTNQADVSSSNSGSTTPKKKGDKNNSLIVFVAFAFIVIIVVAVILINGKEKTVTCTIKANEDNLVIKNSIVGIFKDDNIISMELKGNEQVISDQAEYAELYFNYRTEDLNKYTQIAGVKVVTNRKGDLITYSVNAGKSNSKQLFKEEFGSTKATAEEFVLKAEAEGYKCSTK